MSIVFAKPVVNKEESIVTLTYEGNAFLDNTEVDKDIVKQVFKDMQDTAEASVKEVASKATDIFKEDSKVTRVIATMNTGVSSKDNYEIVIDKEKEYGIPGTDKRVKNSAIVVKTKLPSINVAKSHVKKLAKEIHESVC